jgi:hypothetical protein
MTKVNAMMGLKQITDLVLLRHPSGSLDYRNHALMIAIYLGSSKDFSVGLIIGVNR